VSDHEEALADAAAATVRVVFAAHAWDLALARLAEVTRSEKRTSPPTDGHTGASVP
jgi:hypothetical protein